MIKVLVYVAKAAIAMLTALLLSSCSFGGLKKVNGSGNVITQEREVKETFSSIAAGGGLEVMIEQGANAAVTVEADDNLQEHIKTEVKDGELKITTDVNISNATARVTVRVPDVTAIESSAGANVKSRNTIKSETLDLSSGSGSYLAITVDAKSLRCETASGGNLTVTGKAEKLEAESSSGSTLNAKGLAARKVAAESSSGGKTYVNPTESLSADASSGGNVYYSSTPNELNKKTSSGGNVSQE